MLRHVTAARLQRKLMKRKIEAARAWKKDPDNNPKVLTLVVDYCQNLQYPWYGDKQPGETYYYPHVTVYCLGAVDVADESVNLDGEPVARLHAHIYHEGEGNGGKGTVKGGNNVASLVMKTLEKLDWLKEVEEGTAELNIFFDNCGGQNKNNMVLRLVPYLIENKFFTTVNFTFLIAGHTKNIADRMFNTLKSVFRKSQIWSMQILYQKLTSQTCTVYPYVEGDFKYYDVFFDKFYNKYDRVKKFHIFTCSDNDVDSEEGRITVTCKEYDAEDVELVREDMVKQRYIGFDEHSDASVAFKSRVQKMKDNPPDAIPEGGLNPYKVAELYKNHRKLIPEAWRDITCPKPTKEQLGKVDQEKAMREESKVQIKKMKKDVNKKTKLAAEQMIEKLTETEEDV